MNKKRPIHLALHLIKLPLSGLVSILHRVSGLLLFLALPLLLFALQYSLRSIETYTQLLTALHYPCSKLLLLVLLWAFLHHFCAGLRYLAIDLDYGVELATARVTAKWVFVVSGVATFILGVWLW
ncbi:MAG: succinate dehydrogenase, cytochrome b556 subunit [Gallionellaceae bacterium]|nr:succinate dehydrogenase, cytochrome b556 subunit [Gallionellaceae bacterium]